MADNETRQARALESMAMSVKMLAETSKTTSQLMAKMQHPAYQGKEIKEVTVLENDIAVHFTFAIPDIKGKANIYRQDDGIIRVEILVELEEADHFVTLVEEMDIQTLVVEAAG